MVVSCNGHSILVTLIHIARTTNIRGRENDAMSNGVEVNVGVVV